MARRARVPFRLKLSLLAGTLAVVPAVALGVLLIDVNATAVETGSRELQIALADDVARTVDEGVASAGAELGAVARALTDPDLDPEARLGLSRALIESGTLDTVAVYDAEGRIIDVLREPAASELTADEVLAAPLRAQAAAESVASGEVVATPDGPRLPLVVALRGAGGELTGYAASPVSLAPVQERVQQLAGEHLAAVSGTLFVVDERSRVIADPDAERGRSLASAADDELLSGLDPASLRAARSAEITRDDGERVVATVVPLRDRPWAVVVQVPTTEAYASLGQMRRLVLGTLVLTVLVALGAALLVARRITAPVRTLSDFARDLAARRFDRRVRVQTRDELAELGDAMSRAAEELQQSEARIREETAIRADLGRYLPAELVEKIVLREQDMELGGERREVTVLFADVVAFTPLTEKLPPEEVVSLLNELFTILTEIVFRHEGTVDKLIGDCVMAMWGAPTAQPDHARRALAAAEEMLRWLETANASWNERHGVTVQLAIGVNSGEAVVGNVGSEKRMEYTAIGDVVNVAARLEVIARPNQILCSAATRDAAGDDFDYVEVGERTVAGRAEPVQLYEVRA